MKMHNFSAGPSILPQEVIKQAAESVLNFANTGLSIIEISHRTPAFVEIMEEARELALKLLHLENKGYNALFLQGGASMEFVRIACNLMQPNKKAAYVNTGTWSQKAINEAQLIGDVVEVASSKIDNYNHVPKNIIVPKNTSFLHITTNNTIYGTQFKSFPKVEVPLVADMSSDIFSRDLDYSQFDVIYAGAQKNIGAAGTNLIIIKESVLKNISGKYPNIFNYTEHIKNKSMYNTPAVFSVYTCYLTLKWLQNLGGVAAIGKRNIAKSNLFYSELDRNDLFFGNAMVEDRSNMNATFFLKEDKLQALFDECCLNAGISGLAGHRSVGGYRASMYNAMEFESVKTLVEVMQYLESKS